MIVQKYHYLYEKILKLPTHVYYFVKCFFLFERPLLVIYHYIRRTVPRNRKVVLRNGLKLVLSNHPHDIVTVFVVLVKADYGKVRHDSIVVDVGANIGVFSLYAAHSGARKVYAFEPNQRAYDVLLRNIANNGLEDIIIAYKLAVTDKDSETIKFPLNSSPYNQVLPNDTTENFEECGTITLESILRNNSIAFVDLLKIDCEGMEYEILSNLKTSVFSQIKDIKMECHQCSEEKIRPYLERCNFRITCFRTDSAVLWATKS